MIIMPSVVVDVETGAEAGKLEPRPGNGRAHRISMRKFLLICIKLGITTGVLALLLVKVELGTVIDTMRLVPAPALIVAMTLTVIQPLVGAMRWHLIMRFLGGTLSMTRTLQAYWIGVFASALLPGGVTGDGVRMWILSRAGMRPSKSVNSVLLDRVVALTGLLLLVAASLPFLDDGIADAPVRYCASVLLVGGIALALSIGLLTRFPVAWQRFRAVRAMMHLSSDLRAICRSPSRAAGLVALSALATLCNSLNIFLLVRSLDVPVSFVDSMVLSPLVILVQTLPISIGGWGLREASMVGLFGIVGIPPTVSLSVSILVGLLSVLVSIPGALIRLR
jgi:glycosyltransferase 2 family protein